MIRAIGRRAVLALAIGAWGVLLSRWTGIGHSCSPGWCYFPAIDVTVAAVVALVAFGVIESASLARRAVE